MEDVISADIGDTSREIVKEEENIVMIRVGREDIDIEVEEAEENIVIVVMIQASQVTQEDIIEVENIEDIVIENTLVIPLRIPVVQKVQDHVHVLNHNLKVTNKYNRAFQLRRIIY